MQSKPESTQCNANESRLEQPVVCSGGNWCVCLVHWCVLVSVLFGALVCAGVCAAKPRILEIQIMFSARLLPALLPPFLARLHKITSKFGKTINTLTLSNDVFPSQFLTAPIGSSSSDETTFCCVLCCVYWSNESCLF